MKVSHGEGVAIHTAPESCATTRKGRGEALTGERAGRVFSRESKLLRGVDVVEEGGRLHSRCRQRETPRNPARSETPSTHRSTSHGNREIPGPPAVDGVAGRVGKSKDTRRR